MLMQKIPSYERDMTEKASIDKKLKEMEGQIGQMTAEIQEMRGISQRKDAEI